MRSPKVRKLSVAKIEKRAADFIAAISTETKNPKPRRFAATRDFIAQTWEMLIDTYVVDGDAQVADYILGNAKMMRVIRAFDKSRECSDMIDNEREGFGAGLRAIVAEAEAEKVPAKKAPAKKPVAKKANVKPTASLQKLKDQLSLAKERRKASGERQMSRREISIMSKICAMI